MIDMAEANAIPTNEVTGTQTITVTEETSHGPTLQLKLKKPKPDRKVQWTTETVDNEHMNKKKSKCCCIYEKPKVFGESSSEDEDETDSCHGHKKKCYRHHTDHHDHRHGGAGPSNAGNPVDGAGPSSS